MKEEEGGGGRRREEGAERGNASIGNAAYMLSSLLCSSTIYRRAAAALTIVSRPLIKPLNISKTMRDSLEARTRTLSARMTMPVTLFCWLRHKYDPRLMLWLALSITLLNCSTKNKVRQMRFG